MTTIEALLSLEISELHKKIKDLENAPTAPAKTTKTFSITIDCDGGTNAILVNEIKNESQINISSIPRTSIGIYAASLGVTFTKYYKKTHVIMDTIPRVIEMTIDEDGNLSVTQRLTSTGALNSDDFFAVEFEFELTEA